MIRVENVSKWYGLVVGVNRISLDLEPGVTGLLGVNGAGKSTLLNLMAGLLKPSTGSVSFDGRPVFANPDVLRGIGYCPSPDSLYDDLTGIEFLVFMERLSGMSRKEALSAADRALESVSMGEESKKRIRSMSKGMRQKVKMAQAVIHEPEVILLDEPLNGMDPPSRAQTIKAIKKWGEEGRCVLVSSHLLHEVEAMTSRIVLVHHGKLLASGEVPQVRKAISSRPMRIFLRVANARQLAVELVAWHSVHSVSFGKEAGSLTVEVGDAADFRERLTLLLAERETGVEILNPLDDNLSAVFSYLVA